MSWLAEAALLGHVMATGVAAWYLFRGLVAMALSEGGGDRE